MNITCEFIKNLKIYFNFSLKFLFLTFFTLKQLSCIILSKKKMCQIKYPWQWQWIVKNLYMCLKMMIIVGLISGFEGSSVLCFISIYKSSHIIIHKFKGKQRNCYLLCRIFYFYALTTTNFKQIQIQKIYKWFLDDTRNLWCINIVFFRIDVPSCIKCKCVCMWKLMIHAKIKFFFLAIYVCVQNLLTNLKCVIFFL